MVAWLEFAAGIVVIAATLADVFGAILVPGPSSGQLRVGARVRAAAMPLARLSWRWGKARRRSNSFAPAIFVVAFAAWILLLLLGFGLLFHAAHRHFTPMLDFGDALYVAGSSLITLGVSEVDAHGVARWLVLAAGLSGFAVISATITFILQVQSALHQRESRVLALASLAGTPPSGLQLLIAAGELGDGGDLHDFFRGWRDWSAAALHSHLSAPVLIFFHSVDRESDWLAALEAVLDAAALLTALTRHEANGAATLAHRAGSRTAARLAALMEANDGEVPPLDQAAVGALAARLRGAGYEVGEVDQASVARLTRLRADYAPHIAGLAHMLGTERPLPLGFSRPARPSAAPPPARP